MKKYLLGFIIAVVFTAQFVFTPLTAHAQTPTPVQTTQPPDDAWLSDNEVTFAGKNAARSKDLFNWVLVNYQWSTNDNTLISFWAKIRNVVFVFLILLVMVSAFLMVISGGQSLTAMQFIRKFLVVIILISLSFAFIRILYQIIDVIQSFFIKNPDGKIISSVDLLNISFKYEDFIGYRKYGSRYNESAFISLLLTKITAATYFVMAGVLIIRKVILWFFITVSPIYPVLLLYFPIRNTAKIWIGEFFRWLLYAPLFAIFLSGLVVLWRQNINVLPFHFDAATAKPTIVYPTAINILLGGPGQKLAIDNNINYTDTFAEYIVALIMLWVVIFLPFLLLRIFLDYLSTVSFSTNPAWKYIVNNANKVLPSNDFFNIKQSQPPVQPPPPPPPTYRPTGVAKELPFQTGAARSIPVARPAAVATTNRQVYQTNQVFNTQNIKNVTQTPVYKSQQTSVATSQLVNFPIPTMRDVARYESSRLSSQISSHQEISHVNETLQKIANPQSITNPVERQQFSTIKEKLIQAQKQNEPLAASILQAANHITNRTTVSNVTHISQQVLQKLASPQSVTNTVERQQVITLHEKLTELSKQGNAYATTILNITHNLSTQNAQQSNTQIQQIVEKLANPQAIKDVTQHKQILQLKEELIKEKQQGNQVATSILAASEQVTQATQTHTISQQTITNVQQTLQKLASPQSVTNTVEHQQVTSLKEKLTEQSKEGNTYATTILNTISNISTQNSQQTNTQIQQIVEKLANPQTIKDVTESKQVSQIKEELIKQKQQGNKVATDILAASEEITQVTQTQLTALPETNQVQTVNLEDYEEVKKMWTENYRKIEVPKTLDNPARTREEWIQQDLSKTTNAIDLLSSKDPVKVQDGMREVSALLPFLLVGGFSLTEIVAYLQAKKHAADEVLKGIKEKASEEDTLVDVQKRDIRKDNQDKEMHAEVENVSEAENKKEIPVENTIPEESIKK